MLKKKSTLGVPHFTADKNCVVCALQRNIKIHYERTNEYSTAIMRWTCVHDSDLW